MGFSGADLENLVNQAALKAAVDGKDMVTLKELEFAKDKILMGELLLLSPLTGLLVSGESASALRTRCDMKSLRNAGGGGFFFHISELMLLTSPYSVPVSHWLVVVIVSYISLFSKPALKQTTQLYVVSHAQQDRAVHTLVTGIK